MTKAPLAMPKLGLTMREGIIGRWHVAPGDKVRAGQVLLTIESEKIASDVESPSDGCVDQLLVAEGSTCVVGAPLLSWVVDGMTASFEVTEPRDQICNLRAVPSNTEPPRKSDDGQRYSNSRIRATPLARRRARDAGLELRLISPGNGVRIRAADVTVPAARLQPVPVADITWYTADVDVGSAETILSRLNESGNAPVFDLVHLVVLAAMRALSSVDATGSRILLRRDGVSVSHYRLGSKISLGAVAAAQQLLDESSADLLIDIASDCASIRGARPSSAFPWVLSFGRVKGIFRPDAEGKPTLHREASVMLAAASSAAGITPGTLFSAVLAGLTKPIVLLVS